MFSLAQMDINSLSPYLSHASSRLKTIFSWLSLFWLLENAKSVLSFHLEDIKILLLALFSNK